MSHAVFDHPEFDDHEQVVFARDAGTGLRAIIAVHDTRLGPSLGGCRIWPYATEDQAVWDVLRLSRSMSYKAALAGLPLGGGKSVVITDGATGKTPAMMRALGRAIERLGGRYIVAEDVGATVADMDQIARETAYVTGASSNTGDPSPWTARGVVLAMERAARRRLGGAGLAGARVAVKGVGAVGRHLCALLHNAGARLFVADINEAAVRGVADRFDAQPVAVDEIAALEADIFAPCALGAELNADSIARLRAPIVCGSANNQLASAADDALLAAAGVLYCPDYLVNAGGLILVARPPLGMSAAEAEAKLARIPNTLDRIFDRAAETGVPTGRVADQIARAAFRPDGER